MTNKHYSIRTHVTWLTLLPLLVMAISMATFFLHNRFVDMDHDLLTRGQLIARQLAASSEYGVFSENRAFLNSIADNALAQPDVIGVAVLNAKSNVMVSKGETPGLLASMNRNTLHADKLLERVNEKSKLLDDGNTILLYQPIISTQLALEELDSKPTAKQSGAVIIEMSWAQTSKLKSSLLWFTLLVTTAFLLVTQYLVRIASNRIITTPIRSLNDAVKAIGAGHLETRVTLPTRIDELYTLSNGINQMSADLLHERNILQHRINEATKQLSSLAFFDTLTLLPNRRLLNDRLAHALAACHRSNLYGALMFLDLDNFKPLNDLYGHAAGDLLLIEAANRISHCVREIDTVARFGGDEFVVMLCELDTDFAKSATEARQIAEKIGKKLAEIYHLKYQNAGNEFKKIEHRCTSSIGVVLFNRHNTSKDEILNWADSAMYQAKSEGKNRVCFHVPDAPIAQNETHVPRTPP